MRVLKSNTAAAISVYEGSSLVAEHPLLVLIADDEDDVRAAEEIMLEINERRRLIAMERYMRHPRGSCL